jgi:hypothetical protein
MINALAFDGHRHRITATQTKRSNAFAHITPDHLVK